MLRKQRGILNTVMGLRAEEGAKGESCEQWRWSHAWMCLCVAWVVLGPRTDVL
tara:strand:- start:54 stop:212 length:159 start_codon:yes stop_codon:yes gene_type:complete